jgi:DNA-binding IclR family transcriptional regulator
MSAMRSQATRSGEEADAGVVVPAVRRASEILDVIMERHGEPVSLTELGRILHIPKSSTLNICTELVENRILRRIDGLYALGPKLAALGAMYLSGVDVVREFQNICSVRNPEIQETLKLSILGDHGQVVFLARHDASRPSRLSLDTRVQQPANCTAAGKAMLASLSPSEFEEWLDGRTELPGLTEESIVVVAKLRKELTRVRDRQFAIERGECVEGINCVGIAVRNTNDNALYGLSFAMLEQWATQDHITFLGQELNRIGSDLSVLLGNDLRNVGAPS